MVEHSPKILASEEKATNTMVAIKDHGQNVSISKDRQQQQKKAGVGVGVGVGGGG